MATQHSEQLSALLDGELSFNESKQLLDAVLNQAEEKARLSRYQAYSACLRGDHVNLDHAQLFDNIHQQLTQEPTILTSHAMQSSGQQRLKQFVTGGAIAASVAAVVLIGANNLVPTGASNTIASRDARPVTLASQRVAVEDASADLSKQEVVDLNSYLQEHENMLSGDSLGAGLPLATMVGYGGF